MTRDRDFKRRVRARAEKTGERYAAARAKMTGPAERARVHAETSALSASLASVGVHIDEALLLGIGGGIGAGYIAITHGITGFMIGARAMWWDSVGWVKATCDRLGVPIAFKETTSAAGAARNVRQAISRGAVPMAWLDRARLPDSPLGPEWIRGGYHVVAVQALDDERAVIVDLAPHPVAIDADAFAQARASIGTYRHRIAVPTSAVPDVDAALLAGLQACAEGLVKARARTFMLEGYRAWGEAVRATKGKHAWVTLFPDHQEVARALSSTRRFVEDWAGPALLRPLFADCLARAADRLKRPALRQVAAKYRDCARAWHEVARISDLPELGEAILAAHALEVEAHAALSVAVK